MVAKASCY